jgi:hypothetical protein
MDDDDIYGLSMCGTSSSRSSTPVQIVGKASTGSTSVGGCRVRPFAAESTPTSTSG